MKLINKMLRIKNSPDFINDRRDSKRYDIMLKLDYQDIMTGLISESLTKNISKNGLRFPVSSKLAKGSILGIKVEDPFSDKLLPRKGMVTWLEEFPGEEDAGSAKYEIGVNILHKGLF